jgi:hypothetical protein
MARENFHRIFTKLQFLTRSGQTRHWSLEACGPLPRDTAVGGVTSQLAHCPPQMQDVLGKRTTRFRPVQRSGKWLAEISTEFLQNCNF